ncbi:hypothetical protein L3V86_04170 [Thiotrichales bacterium 19S11-10]|nr:hypothetical protein [Thiotrichales bacterium 19S11-10]
MPNEILLPKPEVLKGINWADDAEKQKAWENAKIAFDNPIQLKVKHERGSAKGLNTRENTSHSFIRIDDKIFAVNAGELAKGASGKVTLAEDENGKLYVIKRIQEIYHKNSSFNTKYNQLETEAKYTAMMGFGIKDITYRKVHKEQASGDDIVTFSVEKGYMASEYKGEPLDKYLKKHKNNLSREQQYTIAIKLFYEIYKMHAKGIAHLDIKPSNFTIDENFNIHAIDFGEADTEINVEIDPKQLHFGTDQYLPKNKEALTREQLDVYAGILVLGGKENYEGKKLTEGCIFNDAILNDHNSFIYKLMALVKMGEFNSDITISEILTQLILEKYNLLNDNTLLLFKNKVNRQVFIEIENMNISNSDKANMIGYALNFIEKIGPKSNMQTDDIIVALMLEKFNISINDETKSLLYYNETCKKDLVDIFSHELSNQTNPSESKSHWHAQIILDSLLKSNNYIKAHQQISIGLDKALTSTSNKGAKELINGLKEQIEDNTTETTNVLKQINEFLEYEYREKSFILNYESIKQVQDAFKKYKDNFDSAQTILIRNNKGWKPYFQNLKVELPENKGSYWPEGPIQKITVESPVPTRKATVDRFRSPNPQQRTNWSPASPMRKKHEQQKSTFGSSSSSYSQDLN